ncbi:DUF4265 domain-containing protein [Roseateles agri]|uniref:DUF4265 domain-containing protein n=1 Tax=Roseateles agri TaxID=3098619 RepID=UPI003D664C6F
MDVGNFRILLELDSSDWHAHSTERLWAEKVVNDGVDCFRIVNSPFFFRGLSNHDVVRAVWSDKFDSYIFQDVLEHSGRSTYMILVPIESSRRFEEFSWPPFSALGCEYERTSIEISMGKMMLYAVDIPEVTNIFDVYKLLSMGESRQEFLFQEGYVGHELTNGGNRQ